MQPYIFLKFQTDKSDIKEQIDWLIDYILVTKSSFLIHINRLKRKLIDLFLVHKYIT